MHPQRRRQQEAQRQREDARAKNNAILVQQEAANNRIQALQDRYAALQQDENASLLRIGEAKQPGPAYWGGKQNRTLLHYPNPQASQLPLLQSHLKDVRREKNAKATNGFNTRGNGEILNAASQSLAS